MRALTHLSGMADIDQLVDDFSFLEDWEDRYRYVIELGQGLEPMPDEMKTDVTKVRGCASQVWLVSRHDTDASTGEGVLTFLGDSDAHIVRGLIAILFAIYSGHTARAILDTDAQEIFSRIGLKEHLTPQRSNGLASMVERIRADAGARLAEVQSA
jgi:cysteine desulfuration protein SufE